MKLWLTIFPLLAACSGKIPDVVDDLAKLDRRPVVIFVPGYYGSALREVGSGKRIFITTSQVLFGNGAYSLFQDELQTPPGPNLELEGLLDTVPVIPSLYAIDVYKDSLKTLAKGGEFQIVTYPYDWRKDLIEAAQGLSKLVNELKARGVGQINIVAHSMGGLVTLYYLGYGAQEVAEAKLSWAGAEKVGRVAFMGTPFGGVYSIFRNMNRGADFSWNEKLLPAEAVASYPASYQLLPFSNAQVLDQAGKAKSLDISDPALWRSRNFGLYARKDLPPEVQTRRDKFVTAQIERAARFMKLINPEKPTPPPASLKVMNVVGAGMDTVTLAHENPASTMPDHLTFNVDIKDKKSKAWKELMTDGDGTVTTVAAQVPKSIAGVTTAFATKESHARIPANHDVLAAIREFVKAP